LAALSDGGGGKVEGCSEFTYLQSSSDICHVTVGATLAPLSNQTGKISTQLTKAHPFESKAWIHYNAD